MSIIAILTSLMMNFPGMSSLPAPVQAQFAVENHSISRTIVVEENEMNEHHETKCFLSDQPNMPRVACAYIGAETPR